MTGKNADENEFVIGVVEINGSTKVIAGRATVLQMALHHNHQFAINALNDGHQKQAFVALYDGDQGVLQAVSAAEAFSAVKELPQLRETITTEWNKITSVLGLPEKSNTSVILEAIAALKTQQKPQDQQTEKSTGSESSQQQQQQQQ